mmetsp:Transcript_34763/g.112176  ORF Transcript_34763/g.112176 Transcript_34763/m.112176 type:complete len:207 (+) Transcript_34763:440-1060(+)
MSPDATVCGAGRAVAREPHRRTAHAARAARRLLRRLAHAPHRTKREPVRALRRRQPALDPRAAPIVCGVPTRLDRHSRARRARAARCAQRHQAHHRDWTRCALDARARLVRLWVWRHRRHRRSRRLCHQQPRPRLARSARAPRPRPGPRPRPPPHRVHFWRLRRGERSAVAAAARDTHAASEPVSHRAETPTPRHLAVAKEGWEVT